MFYSVYCKSIYCYFRAFFFKYIYTSFIEFKFVFNFKGFLPFTIQKISGWDNLKLGLLNLNLRLRSA